VTVIAIDGPAGAGKSTVSRAVARALGWGYLDSGAMYRSVALAAWRLGTDPAAIAARVRIDPGEKVLLDGEDVTDEIRSPQMSELASRAAADPVVREALAGHQRRLLSHGNWVVEGRDIGTVVAPGADLKVFLTADPKERARRRAQELGADPDAVLAELTIRDERDQKREHSPLRPAPGAVQVDTTGKTVDEVAERIVQLLDQGH
jgi:cytidylate kinase